MPSLPWPRRWPRNWLSCCWLVSYLASSQPLRGIGSSLRIEDKHRVRTWRRLPQPETLLRIIPTLGIDAKGKSKREPAPATRLTQRRRREMKGSSSRTSSEPVPRPERICVVCGTALATGRSYCRSCAVPVAIENLAAVAAAGRVAGQMTSHGPEAQARRANARRRHARAASAWQPSSLPA
jgi:hypothetical protein